MSFAPKIIGKGQKLAEIGDFEIWSFERKSFFDSKMGHDFNGVRVIFQAKKLDV